MVVGQIEAKLLMDRANFTQGIKLTQSDMNLLIPNMVAQQNQLAAATGKSAGSMNLLSAAGSELLSILGPMTVATVELHTAWSAFTEYGQQETAINRIVHAAERLKLETEGLRDAANEAGTAALLRGQREEAGFVAFQKLLQVTKDRRQAEYLLQVALDFSTEQNKDLVEVANALAGAHSGNARMLQQLLRGVDDGVKKFHTFGQVMTAVKFAAEGANTVLSNQSKAVYTLAASWDNFKDTLGRHVSPALQTALDKASRLVDILASKPWLTLLPGATGWMYAYGAAALGKRPGAGPEAEQVGPTGEDWKRIQDMQRWQEMWDRIFIKDEQQPGPAKLPKVKDDLAERIKMLEEYMRLQDELARAAEQTDADLTARWEKDHAIQMRLLDGTGQQLKSVFVDLVTEGKFNVEDFGKSFLRMLAEIAASEMWARITENMRKLWGFGSWRTGGSIGGLYEGGWESGGGGGGDIVTAGRRGPRLPEIAASAPTVSTSQPLTVINKTYFSFDAQKFAEAHGETVVRQGLSMAGALGR